MRARHAPIARRLVYVSAVVSRSTILCTSAALLALGVAPARSAHAADPVVLPVPAPPPFPPLVSAPAPAPAPDVAPPAMVGARANAGDRGAFDETNDAERSDLDELSFALGAASLLVTSVIGGTMFARATGPGVRNAGSDILSYGFAAAPFVAHVPSGEYLRGLAFSATPLAMAGGSTALLAADPTAIDEQGTPATRVPYAALFTVGMVSSVVGIVDAAFVSKRQTRQTRPTRPTRQDGPTVALSPSVSQQGASLSLGGRF